MRVFAWSTARTAKHTYEKSALHDDLSPDGGIVTVVTVVTSLSMVTYNIFTIVNSMDDLEIGIGFGDRD